MRTTKRIACIAMLIVAGVTINAAAAVASKGNVLVDAYQAGQTEGVMTASILRSMGYKVTFVESLSNPRQLPSLSKYSTVWELRALGEFTAAEREAFETYVSKGGHLFLNGEGGCCESINAGDQAIARNLLKDQEIAIASEPRSSGAAPANPNAEDGVTTQPNTLATVPAESAGTIGNIPNENVLAATESGAVGGVFDEQDMLNGKGRLVIDMSAFWLGADWHESPGSGNAGARNRLEVIENIQDFLEKTPTRTPAPSAEYVALGDSLASGVGSFSYLPGTTGKKGCYRATKGYVERLAEETGFSLDFQACNGATAARLSTGNKDQLRAVGSDTKLVTLSIGGTDVGLRSIIERCLDGRPAGGSTDACFHANDEAVKAALGWLRFGREPGTYRLPGNKKKDKNTEPMFGLDVIDSAILEQAPDAKLLVVGYPKLFETGREQAVACDITGGAASGPKTLDAAEVESINQHTEALDEVIQNAVAQARARTRGDVRYVDPGPVFAGHGLCDTGESFVNPFVSESRTTATPESLNPTAVGQEQLSHLIGEAVNE